MRPYFNFDPQRLTDLILGTDRKQRLRLQRSLLAGVVYAASAALLVYGAAVDSFHLSAGLVALLVAWVAGVVIGFYLLIRTGWNLRCADPALTVPQMVLAIVTIACGYVVTEHARGATLALLELVLVFGMFTLSPRESLRLGSLAVALLGLAMLGLWLWRPEAHPLEQEIVHFGLVATIVPVLSLLAGQLTRLRERLQSQKLELAYALARIQDLATRDELTQLFNRRHMRELVAEQRKRLRRSGGVFSLALVDLDHFKRINDGHGHAAGDEVLRGFARHAQASLRETDVVGRWGGEEFLVLFPETSAAEAMQGLERLHVALKQVVVSASVPHLRITFSAGLTEHGVDESDAAAIERADRALYAAKAAGRDRIKIHQRALHVAERSGS